MPHDVIMPALGMAQETGRIVAWLKKPGDAVRAGEPLMEVETDKATVEIEAQAAGFLADLRAEAGTDVPVGEVIAVIAREKPEASAARTGEGGSDAAAGAPPGASGRAADDAAAAVTDGADPEPPGRPISKRPSRDAPVLRAAPSAAEEGRVLASPLARRLAAERGLDLARLAAGRSTPVHAADLDALADAAAQDAATAIAAPATASAPMHVAAEAPAGELDALIAWAAAEGSPRRRPVRSRPSPPQRCARRQATTAPSSCASRAPAGPPRRWPIPTAARSRPSPTRRTSSRS